MCVFEVFVRFIHYQRKKGAEKSAYEVIRSLWADIFRPLSDDLRFLGSFCSFKMLPMGPNRQWQSPVYVIASGRGLEDQRSLIEILAAK